MKLVILLAAILTASATATAAEIRCGSRATIVALISGPVYDERRVGLGLDSRSQIVELFTNPSTGSFTIVITNTQGWSCIVRSGNSWEQIDPTPAIEKES